MFYLYEMLEIGHLTDGHICCKTFFLNSVLWLYSYLGLEGVCDSPNTFINKYSYLVLHDFWISGVTAKPLFLIPINIPFVTEAFLTTIHITYSVYWHFALCSGSPFATTDSSQLCLSSAGSTSYIVAYLNQLYLFANLHMQVYLYYII